MDLLLGTESELYWLNNDEGLIIFIGEIFL